MQFLKDGLWKVGLVIIVAIFCLVPIKSYGNIEPCRLKPEKITVKNYSHVEVHYLKGNFYLNNGMVDEAILEYERLLDMGYSYSEVHNNLGVAYFYKGMVDEAILEYERALEINPKYAEVHNNLAVAYFAKGDFDLAWKHIRILEMLGHSPDPQFIELLKESSKMDQK